jgi:hypothetical protein
MRFRIHNRMLHRSKVRKIADEYDNAPTQLLKQDLSHTYFTKYGYCSNGRKDHQDDDDSESRSDVKRRF